MPSKFDNLADKSECQIQFIDGPHKGRYITHGKPRVWYSLEVKNTNTYTYYRLTSDIVYGRGKKKARVYLYSFQQIDKPETALANTMEEWKRDGKKYDLTKI